MPDCTMIRKSSAIMVMLVLLLASVALAEKYGKIEDYEWEIGPPADYPEAGAVVIFNRGELSVTKSSITIDYHVRIKILNEAGIDEVGEMSVMYDDDDEKLKEFKAQTITPEGKKHEVKKDAIFEKKAGSYKSKSWVFPLLEPGCIVEYKYTIKTKQFFYLKPWYFQGPLYTMVSEFSVSLVPGFSYNVDYFNVPFDRQSPEVTERPDPSRAFGMKIKTFTWKLAKLPPIKDEPYMSSVMNFRSALRFKIESYKDAYNMLAFTQTWAEVGKGFGKYIEDYCNKSKDVKKLAEEVTTGLTTPEEKSQALFDYVVTEFKTAEDEHGRWFTFDKMSKLLENRYGTGEEKNVLLTEMHRALDIPCWPVLISTRDRARFDPKYASLRQFNYIIVFTQFTDKWEFLDTANPHAIYGLLPPQCLTNGGLLLDGDKSDLVRITVKPVKSARIDKNWMYIDDNGLSACSSRCEFSGYYAADYGQYLDRETKEEFFNQHFVDRLGVECDLGECTCDLDSARHLTACLHYTSGDLVERLDNNVVVDPIVYAFRENPFKSSRRFFPVDFTYPFEYRNITEIMVSETVKTRQVPEKVSYTFGELTYSRNYLVTDSSIVVDARLEVNEPEILPHLYGGLREFFANIAAATEDPVTFVLEEQ